jgi:adenylate cyclase
MAAADGIKRRCIVAAEERSPCDPPPWPSSMIDHPAPSNPSPPDAAPRSVAVLPFQDRSSDQDLEHLCDGIAEEIRSSLARLEGLQVTPRASTTALKKHPLGARDAGRRLDVGAIVTGSIGRSDDVLAVDSELVDVTDGTILWSAAFNAGDTDLLTIQEEIARGIADLFRLHLSDAQLRAIGRAGTRNAGAYESYLRGRQLFFRCSRKGIDEAVAMFHRAIAEDPSYALAYAGLADCHAYLFMYFDPSVDNLKFAGNASTHALALDRDLAEAHAARGLSVSLSQEYDEAETEFEEAIRLDPSLFEAHYFYARTCFAAGKYEKACRHYEEASAANRDDAQSLTLLGFTYRKMGEDELATDASARALARLDRLLELDPDDPRTNYLSADAFLQVGKPEAALQRAERAVSLAPDDPYTVYGLSCIYGRLEMVDEGIVTLRRAVECGFGHRAWIVNDSDLDALRNDDRFRVLVDSLATPTS